MSPLAGDGAFVVGAFRTGFIAILPPSSERAAFFEVYRHVDDHFTDMAVGDAVEYVFGLTVADEQPRSTKQTQMVAHQRLREFEFTGDVTDRFRTVGAVHDDP